MSSTKVFNMTGTMTHRDLTTKHTANITFDAQANKRTGYWTSWVKGADKVNKESGVLDNRRDLVQIQIQKEAQFAGEKPKVLCEGFGSYLEQITFDE